MQFDPSCNIRLYQDVFFPPEGYEIEWAELTTWSLAKDWLRLIAAMIAAGNRSPVKVPLTRPNSFIKAAGEEALRFHVFYDGKYQLEQETAAFYQMANGRYAAYLYETRCTPVKLEHLFHPKLILLQFRARGGGALRFRLFVSSRNLTWSSYIESGALLEGAPSEGKLSEDAPGPAMARFLEKYYEKSGENVPKCLDLEGLKKADLRVVTPEGACVDQSPELHFGSEKKLGALMKDSFLYWKSVNSCYQDYTLRVSSMKPTWALMENEAEYQCQYICNFKDMYQESERRMNVWKREKGRENAWYLCGERRDGKKDIANPQPLHAKHYMFWGGTPKPDDYSREKRSPLLVWLGSANCSANALTKINEEALVRFCAEACLDQFPGADPRKGNADYGQRRRGAETLYFCHEETVCNPVLPELEDEDGPERIGIKVRLNGASYDPETQTLCVNLTNGEDTEVSVWPAACSEADTAATLPENQKRVLSFPLEQRFFSRLLLIRKGEVLFALRMTLLKGGKVDDAWYGADYGKLSQALPADPLVDLGGLIQEQPYFTEGDNACEKLLKCKMYMDPGEFAALVSATLDAYWMEKRNLEQGEGGEDSEDEAMLAQIFSRERDCKEFKDLLGLLGAGSGETT